MGRCHAGTVGGSPGGAPLRPRKFYYFATVYSITLTLATGCGSGAGGSLPPFLEDLLENGQTNSTIRPQCGPLRFDAYIPDCPLGIVCFTRACERHNQCYGDCEAQRAVCDTGFYTDMLTICESSFPAIDPNLNTCRSLAFSYWLAVSLFGEEAFEATQAGQCNGGDLPPFTPGACCDEGVCDDTGNLGECEEREGVFFQYESCEDLECVDPANDDCADAGSICAEFDPFSTAGTCAGNGDPCDVTLQGCADDSECMINDDSVLFCEIETNNRLATTDGPPSGDVCFTSGDDPFQADIWYRMEAPCTGRMTARMCDVADYDAMLAVFGTDDPEGGCLCPTDNEMLIECNDDFCGPGSVSAVVVDQVVAGACYTFRVGGWSTDNSARRAGQGVSELEITIRCEESSMEEPATDDLVADEKRRTMPLRD